MNRNGAKQQTLDNGMNVEEEKEIGSYINLDNDLNQLILNCSMKILSHSPSLTD